VNDIVYTRAGNVMQDNIPERSRISIEKIAAAEQLTVLWIFCEILMHPYHLLSYHISYHIISEASVRHMSTKLS
jgi:hypothetical protein